jgi:hypothetical protein
MLRFWHELSSFYHALSPALSAFKRQYKTPFFGYHVAAAPARKRRCEGEAYHGNCLTFAIGQRVKHGGQIVTVKSRFGWWCHAYWMAEDGTVYEFAPVQPHRKVQKLWHPLPPLVYEGRMRRARVLPAAALRKINEGSGLRPVTSMGAAQPSLHLAMVSPEADTALAA